MRKITYNIQTILGSYNTTLTITIKEHDFVSKLYSGPLPDKNSSFETRMMSDEYFKLKVVNDILVLNNMDKLTEIEFMYMIDPIGYRLSSIPDSVENLQKLAGIRSDIPFGTELYTEYLNRLQLASPDIKYNDKKVTKIEISIGEDGIPVGMKCFNE